MSEAIGASGSSSRQRALPIPGGMTTTLPPHRLRRLLRSIALAVGLTVLFTGCTPYSFYQERTRELVNDSRADFGRQRLPMNATVAAKAQAWARHLADCRCLQHSNLASGVPAGWRAIAENVGYSVPGGNLPSVQRLFMNSSAHRANILNRWTVVGTGVAARGTTKYVVHVFVLY